MSPEQRAREVVIACHVFARGGPTGAAMLAKHGMGPAEAAQAILDAAERGYVSIPHTVATAVPTDAGLALLAAPVQVDLALA